MGKEVATTVAYLSKDVGQEVLGDPANFKPLILGHLGEDVQKVTVRDIRGQESQFSLDTHGFEFRNISLSPEVQDVTDAERFNEDSFKQDYYHQVAEFIKKIRGAKEVVVGGQVIRKSKRDELTPEQFIPGQVQGPSPKIHNDTAGDLESAKEFAKVINPDAGDMIDRASRVELLGVWRPTSKVQRDPLVFVDSRTVREQDCRYGRAPKYNTTLLTKSLDNAHKWYFCSEMESHEVILLKFFDTRRDVAWRCPHSSIPLPGTEHLPARESFEVRAVVCY